MGGQPHLPERALWAAQAGRQRGARARRHAPGARQLPPGLRPASVPGTGNTSVQQPKLAAAHISAYSPTEAEDSCRHQERSFSMGMAVCTLEHNWETVPER